MKRVKNYSVSLPIVKVTYGITQRRWDSQQKTRGIIVLECF